MFHLYDVLPNSVQFMGDNYQLNLTFDVVLLAFSALRDQEMTPDDRLETFLSILVKGRLPATEHWPKLFDSILELLNPIKPKVKQYDINGDPIELPNEKKSLSFDFDVDADLIYAAFWQTYGIDLTQEQGKLHWYSFKALLNGLPDDTLFTKVRQIRQTDLSKIKNKEQKREMRRMKREVALPNEDDREEESEEYGS